MQRSVGLATTAQMHKAGSVLLCGAFNSDQTLHKRYRLAVVLLVVAPGSLEVHV
jgi:hypothetical protein